MDGFSVSLTALSTAATAASAAAAGIDGVEVGAVLGRLAAALPGGATAASAGLLAQQWDTTRRALAAATAVQADHLARAAASYGATDTVMADGFGGCGPVVALSDLRRWDAGGVEGVFVALGDASRELGRIEDRAATARTSPQAWQGATADAARAGHDALVARLQALRAGVDAARFRVADAADAVEDVRAQLADVEAQAAATGFAIGPDGSVTDVRQTVVAAGQADAYRAERVAAQSRLVDALRAVLTRADAVDTDLVTALRRTTAASTAGTGTPTFVAGLGTPMDIAPPPVDIRTPIPVLDPPDRGFTPAPEFGPLITVPAPSGPSVLGTPPAPDLGSGRVYSEPPPFPPPTEITGRTAHGEQQIQSRDGHGVNDEAVDDAVANPTQPPVYVPDRYGGYYKFKGQDAEVSLNKEGQVVTAWARSQRGWRHP